MTTPKKITTFRQYSKQAAKTAVFPTYPPGTAISYLALGLTGEAGEVANQVKKILRDDGGFLSAENSERKAKILDEIGDCLWYLALLSKHMGTDLETVAGANLDKLAARAQAGTIKGDKRGGGQ